MPRLPRPGTPLPFPALRTPLARWRRFRMKRVMTLLAAASVLVGSTTTGAQAAVTPDGWNSVTAANSGKCVDARAAGTANGTVVQQYSCNQTASQQWQFQSTGDGYFRVNARTNPA